MCISNRRLKGFSDLAMKPNTNIDNESILNWGRKPKERKGEHINICDMDELVPHNECGETMRNYCNC